MLTWYQIGLAVSTLYNKDPETYFSFGFYTAITDLAKQHRDFAAGFMAL